MNVFFALLIPLLFVGSFLYASAKKVKVYDSFTAGASKAIPLITSIFPYIATVTVLSKLLEVSGVESWLIERLSPLFSFTGVPREIAGLLMVKPLSGSGSIAMLADILGQYGVDSYVSRCACVAYGAGETIFYVGAVYFAGLKRKSLPVALTFALVSYFIAVVFCCFVCRIL